MKEIEVLELEENDLDRLALNARVLINAIDPYHRFSSPVLAACTRNGAFYVDCTTETLWIQDMIGKYQSGAIDSGAVIIPAMSLSSSPPGIIAWHFRGNQLQQTRYVPPASRFAAVTIQALTWIGTILLAFPLFRSLLGNIAIPQGIGPTIENSRTVESVEFKTVGFVEGEDAPRANGYVCLQGVNRAKAAENEGRDLSGGGGIFTPSSLGMSFVERLRKVGVVIEAENL
ncbi:hypothetical protein DL98DRAFT_537688 [Cadophora sp. DSE1049]|nr:hypothetical protein DL98DRAFT_537688 [Cadophora sp. DSE1049]